MLAHDERSLMDYGVIFSTNAILSSIKKRRHSSASCRDIASSIWLAITFIIPGSHRPAANAIGFSSVKLVKQYVGRGMDLSHGVDKEDSEYLSMPYFAKILQAKWRYSVLIDVGPGETKILFGDDLA